MKAKGWMIAVGWIVLAALLLYGGINLYALLSARGKLFEPEDEVLASKKVDAILVLGAGVRKNNTPSNMLEDRLLTALNLYEKRISDRIIVSGDHGQENYDEVGVMKKYLVEKGVPSESIFMDHAGFNTYDSLYRCKAIFGVKTVAVVTQRYHAYRSLMIGNSLGLSAICVPAPILSTSKSSYPKQPWYSFRESLARVKDFVCCWGKPEPKYLGEKIDLRGNGDVTNG